jgi:hypothetical protein
MYGRRVISVAIDSRRQRSPFRPARWAFVDEAKLLGIVDRSAALANVPPAYRGSIAINRAGAQAPERISCAERWWNWLEHDRRARHEQGGRVALDALAPNGDMVTWSEIVVEGRGLPVPLSGAPPDAATKIESELVVAAFERYEPCAT